MIMWTNQPYVVYEQLRQTGILAVRHARRSRVSDGLPVDGGPDEKADRLATSGR